MGVAASRSPQTAGCGDRRMPPAQTVERMRPWLLSFGITRLGRQTGLDRIGIPCWAAFRPNALTLANSQGKGLDDMSACASALMEAVEFSIAERPQIPVEQTSLAALRSRDLRAMDLRRLMPIGLPIASDVTLPFATGFDIYDDSTIAVPAQAAELTTAPGPLARLVRSTNGLASGNNEDEAVFHGLCELVERDANTMASLSRDAHPLEVIAPELFEDEAVSLLAEMVADAGLKLWINDETSDIGVPCLRAVIGETSDRYFDLSAGYGCHPVAARAAIRAITEAAQTRVTNIAGSRDDFMPQEFARRPDRSLLERLNGARQAKRLYSRGVPPGTSLDDLLSDLKLALYDHGVRDVAGVRLGGEVYGISVIKLFAPDLEDRPSNRNWRPGRRAITSLARAA
jgi:YcaO-like protein with predicted kinase domain